jgi:hypothetical protein
MLPAGHSLLIPGVGCFTIKLGACLGPRTIASPSFSDYACPLQYSARHSLQCSCAVEFCAAGEPRDSNELSLWTQYAGTYVEHGNCKGNAREATEQYRQQVPCWSDRNCRCILPVSRNNNHIVTRSSLYKVVQIWRDWFVCKQAAQVPVIFEPPCIYSALYCAASLRLRVGTDGKLLP